MKKGFTLSEVLITLGIVGVVAVLTVPACMRSYQNRLYVTQLQKIYAQLSDATLAIMNDEHVDNFYDTKAGVTQNADCTQGLCYFLNNYFEPVKKDCGKNAGNLCIAGLGADSYKTLSGANAGTINNQYCIQTSRGAAICGFHNATNSTTSIGIDVNGVEKPNIVGRDVFVMDIKTDGSIADYNAGNVPGVIGCQADKCSTDGAGTIYQIACGCLTNVMEAGWKMEY